MTLEVQTFFELLLQSFMYPLLIILLIIKIKSSKNSNNLLNVHCTAAFVNTYICLHERQIYSGLKIWEKMQFRWKKIINGKKTTAFI